VSRKVDPAKLLQGHEVEFESFLIQKIVAGLLILGWRSNPAWILPPPNVPRATRSPIVDNLVRRSAQTFRLIACWVGRWWVGCPRCQRTGPDVVVRYSRRGHSRLFWRCRGCRETWSVRG